MTARSKLPVFGGVMGAPTLTAPGLIVVCAPAAIVSKEKDTSRLRIP
jgi:hypothetical protein